MTCLFKVGKTYKTVDGADVLIIAVDDNLYLPVVGIVTAENGLKSVFQWTVYGYSPTAWPCRLYLVKPEPVIKTIWINVYRYMDGNESGFALDQYLIQNEALSQVTKNADYIGTFPFSFEVPGDE